MPKLVTERKNASSAACSAVLVLIFCSPIWIHDGRLGGARTESHVAGSIFERQATLPLVILPDALKWY
jgi:hypothetical protein